MTKRKVANKIEELEEATANDDAGDPLIVCYTVVDETPHPELTVIPYPERRPDMRSVATPNYIPEQFLQDSTLFINICDDAIGFDPHGEEVGVRACEIWDSMTEEQLQQEYEYRKEQGEPIPDILSEYE